MSANHYKLVINLLQRIIKEDKSVVMDILVEVASTSPSVLIKSCDNLGIVSEIDSIKELFIEEGRVPAIKKYREIYNCTLREAQNKIDLISRTYKWDE